MMKFRLIRITFEFYPWSGGSVTHLVELSRNIDKVLGGQTIIAPAYGADYSGFDQAFGVPVLRVKYNSFGWLAATGFPAISLILLSYAYNVVGCIRRLAREGKADIIHVHGDMLGAFVKLFLRLNRIHIPVVVYRGGGIMNRWSLKPLLITKLALWLICLIRPDHVIIVDDGTRIDRYVAALGKRKIPFSIVYHAIDTKFYTMSPPRQGDEFVVLSTSGVNAFKRLDMAIRAFARFLDKVKDRRDMKFYIVGQGPLIEELTKLCADLGISDQVCFTGGKNLEEVLGYLHSADVVVGTSPESNMNLSTQEAMACGKPVVAFDCGGIRSLITSMENGVLVKTGDLDAFAESLFLLYRRQDLREALGRKARETIITSRNWSARLSKELETYQIIAHRPR